MARIYKRSDRIAIKIDDITIKVAPLTIDQKVEIQQYMLAGRRNADIQAATKGMCLAIKYSVKSLTGVEDADGQPYKIELDDSGNVTDDCIDELLNLRITDRLSLVCASLVNGIADAFTDETGKPLTGVEIIASDKGEPASKNG